jgi:Lon protease-like protein
MAYETTAVVLVPLTGHCRLRMLDEVTHDAGLVAEGLVVRYCADWTSLTKAADRVDVSPEFEVLLPTAFSWVSTESMATQIAPATRGITTMTTNSSTSVNPLSSFARGAWRWLTRALRAASAVEREAVVGTTRVLNSRRALTTRLFPPPEPRSVSPNARFKDAGPRRPQPNQGRSYVLSGNRRF